MAIDFKKALDMVKERGLFQGITRFKYDGEGYDLNESLQLVEALGKPLHLRKHNQVVALRPYDESNSPRYERGRSG